MYMKPIPFVLAAFLSLPTLADEASVKKAVEAKIARSGHQRRQDHLPRTL
jgi:hypothetical protein